MLQLSASLLDKPVMSLRTGGIVAQAISPIINPNNLKIEGWYCRDHFSKKTLILLATNIRDFVPQGIAVDDHEVLTEPEELIRMRDIIDLDFELLGKPVYSDLKRRLGKVSDYACEMNSLYIQKLYVAQRLIRSISGGQLTIDRTQIVEITPDRVTVRDAAEKINVPAPAMGSA
jgi:hypothetical protein